MFGELAAIAVASCSKFKTTLWSGVQTYSLRIDITCISSQHMYIRSMHMVC